ncbi:MAG: hypothetical protein DCC55_29095 [Chloroflexi bacterium]|nr:MAG: hypothetical protein DCC55_29095 [Chloroflexota bacterium]
MRRQPPLVEWHIAQDDAEWERLRAQAAAGAKPVGPTVYNRRRLALLLVFFLILAGAGGWWWQRTTSDAALTPTAPIVSTESQQTIAHPGAARPAVATPPPTPGERSLPLQRTEASSSQEVVRMTSHPEQAHHTYQDVSTGALRTALDAAFWGPPRRLETTSFIIHFRHRDARAVTRAAPEIEVFYSTLQENFGLPLAWDERKLVFVVSEGQPSGPTAYQLAEEGQFIVRSPSLYEGAQLAADMLLAQSMALALVDHVIAQAAIYHTAHSSRRHVFDALRLWQLWNTDLPLAAWRVDIVRWLYFDLPGAPPGQAPILPARYPALCAEHALWLPYPAALQIPLVCTNLDQSKWQPDSRYAQTPLRRLPRLWAPVFLDEEVDAHGRTYPEKHPGETIALATFIEYIVFTFGQERLPELVGSLGRHESWRTLLPVVFDVSVAEAEAGWQAHLQATYGQQSVE